MNLTTQQTTQLNHTEIETQAKQFPISILANDIEIAGNVGSLFRVAEAFGVKTLFLTGTTAVPPKYKIRKAARSADQKVAFEYTHSATQLLENLKQQGYQILSLEITNDSQKYPPLPLRY